MGSAVSCCSGNGDGSSVGFKLVVGGGKAVRHFRRDSPTSCACQSSPRWGRLVVYFGISCGFARTTVSQLPPPCTKQTCLWPGMLARGRRLTRSWRRWAWSTSRLALAFGARFSRSLLEGGLSSRGGALQLHDLSNCPADERPWLGGEVVVAACDW